MSNQRTEQPTTDTIRVKSDDAVQATKSGHFAKPTHRTTPVTGKKRWPSARFIALMLLVGITAIFYFTGILYLLRSVLASTIRPEFEALVAVIFVLACGGLLIRRVSRVLGLEEEEQIESPIVKDPTVPLSEANRAELQVHFNSPPPVAGQNVDNKTEKL